LTSGLAQHIRSTELTLAVITRWKAAQADVMVKLGAVAGQWRDCAILCGDGTELLVGQTADRVGRSSPLRTNTTAHSDHGIDAALTTCQSRMVVIPVLMTA
jgi:hypothetical protein